MHITGNLLIAGQAIQTSKTYKAINPVTNQELNTEFYCADQENIDQACKAAFEAFDHYRSLPLEKRAQFLDNIADNIEALGDVLTNQTRLETGLPEARVKGETGRTVNQLRLFSSVVRQGDWMDLRFDPALPDRAPLPRPDLRQIRIAIGPVAVFGASNFPLAFSVAGGDTASALAAGCPVVVKAHPSHPGTSELIGQAIAKAIKDCGLPSGVFSLIGGTGNDVGEALVKNPYICAVGFTGSMGGGTALMRFAAERPVPIPVFAEMGSINPVYLFDRALQNRAESIAKGFIGSLSMSAGQLCTNPGLIIAKSGAALDSFLTNVQKELAQTPTSTMLSPSIHQAFLKGIQRLTTTKNVNLIGQGQDNSSPNQCQSIVCQTDAQTFIKTPCLSEEIFGAAALIVTYNTIDELHQITENLQGQLTVTLHINQEDIQTAHAFLPIMERKAGRILVNGWPTGVEVSSTMVHGGPFPATSDSRMTSVGTAAIERFLRPICYQNFPSSLLPTPLQDSSISEFNHRIDGKYVKK
ncbi:aldehyde dehydrogenase (NADP(+)) [Commensalibacter communis]|uniref:aldehyde dehydrogenase (NADP(+)) n=1 Tax=Commensalibacter communis TaxID=2972786 RepID=UPI0022FFADD9|nr:aldehyde dehydrogenase (NADP(+)) [Commensalibacter communis]CAI3936475.1 Acyl-CoA reductase or other NAD-dependent aldehyde dehydrogenase (AdhE) (PDB:1A4S) [Commensalibacter communis]CAI3941665.1 Acyl-CoA reductase or other NAD-dependent aldehyde dehydrogenase (AdhE) (PDB:1A4S) [Commensalibacter communis]